MTPLDAMIEVWRSTTPMDAVIEVWPVFAALCGAFLVTLVTMAVADDLP